MSQALSPPLLTIVDVGHGNCTVLRSDTETILIDTGQGSSTLEYLLEQEISVIDTVVISHADADHIGGLIALLGASDKFHVKRVVLNTDASKDTQKWLALAYEIDELRRSQGLRFDVQLREGDEIATTLEGVKLAVLAPRDRLVMLGPGQRDRENRKITSNSISAVIRVEVGSRHVCLTTGDLDAVGMDHLLATGQDITADVLVFPHHGGLPGSKSAETEEFAFRLTSAVSPKEIAISLSRNGTYRNPKPEIIQGIRRAAASARIACTQLSRNCVADLPEDEPTHLLPLFAHGRERRSCCAGTMQVELSVASMLSPARVGHIDFINAVAPGGALCTRSLP